MFGSRPNDQYVHELYRDMSIREKLIKWEPRYEPRIKYITFPTCKTWSVKPIHHSQFHDNLANNADYNPLMEDAVACHREMWSIVHHPELRDPEEHAKALQEHYNAYLHPTVEKPKGLGRAASLKQGLNRSCERSRFATGRAARLRNRIQDAILPKPGGLQHRLRAKGEV